LVQEEVHEKFVATLKQKAEAMRVGNGLEETSELGPIISNSQMTKVLEYVEEGRTEGKLITGGTRLTKGELSKGNFVAPTVFDDVPTKARIAQEEIFGPVVVVMPFDKEDEAVKVANDSVYGLAAAVWTRDIKTAFDFARKVRAGTVWVNSYGKTFPEAEFGGYKQSGIGRERGLEGLHEYTQLKHVYLEL
jgi:betaine-aldehyde dehydrogenase